MMQELTLQQYAKQSKQSLFAVIKQVQSGALKSIKKEVNGKEVELVLCESLPVAKEPEPSQDDAVETPSKIDYEVEFHKLLARYHELQNKYEKLLMQSF